MKLIDLIGLRFGRLVVIKRIGTLKGQPQYECECDCGNKSYVTGPLLRTGSTKSCGCFRRDFASKSFTSHGMKNTKVYKTWESMKTRCGNIKRPDYMNYGGRGISVCESWLTFENFFADMGNPPPGSTLERIDNNGNYEPANCRWASRIDQGNNKRNNRFYEYNGVKKTLSELARDYDIKYLTLYKRVVVRGWPIDRAIESFPGLHINQTVSVRL